MSKRQSSFSFSWLTLLVSGAIACAAEPMRPARAAGGVQRTLAAPSLAVDLAVELAMALPAGADRCVVARPGRLSAEQRALFRAIAQAEPVAWSNELHVAAYASALRARAESRAASVIVLRFADDAGLVRARLDAASGLELRWDSPEALACAQASCPTVARFVDAHTVRLARGVWEASGQAAGSERACVALANGDPEAVEVSARRNASLLAGGPSDLPIETRSIVVASPAAAQLTRDDLMPSSEAAERLVQRGGASDAFGGVLSGFDLAATSRTQEDLVVHTKLRLCWDDLRLRFADERRLVQARRYADALGQVHADANVDFDDAAAVLAELAVREQLARDSSADPSAVRSQLLAFVARGLAKHPESGALRAAHERLGVQVTTPGEPAMTPP